MSKQHAATIKKEEQKNAGLASMGPLPSVLYSAAAPPAGVPCHPSPARPSARATTLTEISESSGWWPAQPERPPPETCLPLNCAMHTSEWPHYS